MLRIFDESTNALVIERVTMGGGGVKSCPILRDVIYGRPLKEIIHYLTILIRNKNRDIDKNKYNF